MGSRDRKIILIIALIVAAAVIAAVCIYMSPASPAEENAPVSPAAVQAGTGSSIIISELMEKNRAVLRDEDGDFSDWIELHNVSDKAVSLSGWRISDKSGDPGWAFPGVTIEPGEYLLVFASGKDKSGSELHTDFSLSGDETVYLLSPAGSVANQAACGGTEADVSMALGADGEWAQSLYPTPGYENSAAGYDALQETLSPADALVISEVMVANTKTYYAGAPGYCDWVELKNISDSDISLSGYYLSDSLKDLSKYALPDSVLAPGGTIIILCGADDDGSGVYNLASFSLNSSCEQLYLSRSEELVDYAALRDIPYECSFGRMDGENGWFYFAKPSPGKANANGARRVAAKPVNLTADGVFDGVEGVTVELSGAGTVRYTLDGSTPTEKSPEYTEPITVSSTGVVKAVSFEDGALPSRTLMLSYIINEGHSLPVVSLVSEDTTEFSQMYNGPAKGVELPASISLYRGDGGFTAPCGVSLNGETSLIMSKKNMSLRFRGAYGQETLQYDIFGGGATEFTNLLLRAGQDQEQTIIRNELSQSLCEKADMDVINQRSIFCVLYVNGEYSGIYTLKEKANKYLYAAVAGVDPDSVEVIEAPAGYGTEFYDQIIRFAYMNDMSLDENYEHLASLMDMDGLIDWLIMEGFCANTDVTSGNLRYCRSEQADGKWQFMFYDLDATFVTPGAMYANLLSEYGVAHIQVSSLAVPLMQNAGFKDRFLTRAAELLSDKLSNEAVINEISTMTEELSAEVDRDFSRYGKDRGSWEWSLEQLLYLVDDCDWRQQNIDALCFIFGLSGSERSHYFGSIDGA